MQISFLLWRTFDRMLRLVARLSGVLLLTPQSWAVIYEVGPGHTLQKLSSVPWASLHPGDTVNIHYQPDGYHEIILRPQTNGGKLRKTTQSLNPWEK